MICIYIDTISTIYYFRLNLLVKFSNWFCTANRKLYYKPYKGEFLILMNLYFFLDNNKL